MIALFPEILLTGLTFGGSNGISPGPLSLLTISETLRGGAREGFKVACSPLVTDLPIITLCILLFSWLPNRDTVLALISSAGAFFLFYLAYKSFRFGPPAATGTEAAPDAHASAVRGPLARGVATNFLNPYPYLFWITVGAPYVLQLQSQGTLHLIGFFCTFYLGMLLAKGALIVATVRGGQLLSTRGYLITMRIIGVLMSGFGLKFANQAYILWSAKS